MRSHPKLLILPILVTLLLGCQRADKTPPATPTAAIATQAPELSATQTAEKPTSDVESETQTAEYEGIRVTVTYPKLNARLADLMLQIIRQGVIVYDDKVAPWVSPTQENNSETSIARPPEFYNLDADPEMEIVLMLVDRGSTCCAHSVIFDYDSASSRYISTWKNWMSFTNAPKFEDMDGDGSIELVSQNKDYAFILGPSAMKEEAPIQIWQYTQDGLQDVTLSHLERIIQDADQWWQSYTDEGSDWYANPVALSAYISDECMIEELFGDAPGERGIDWDQAIRIFHEPMVMTAPPKESWHEYRIDLDRILDTYGYACNATRKAHQLIAACGLGCHEVLPAPEISFSYEPIQAIEVISDTLLPDLNLHFGLQDPQHYALTFDGYQHVDYGDDPRWNRSQISIYPVDVIKVSNTAADLRVILDQRLTTPSGTLPCLGMRGAAQIIQAGISYLDFQNGSGMRYLTSYAQAAYHINNPGLFYTFQGLTDDGRYYISATFSVSNPVLDKDIVVWDEDKYTWLAYIEDIEALLSAQPAESFTPDLSLLDEMMRSLLVE